jgi:Glycosyltransferase
VKKKICFFCSVGSFDTGMPISTFKLIEHFYTIPEYQVFALLPAAGELSGHLQHIGIKPDIIPFHRLQSMRRFIGFLKFLFLFPLAFFRITRYLVKNKIDLVHFSDIIDMPFYGCSFLARATCIAHLRHCIENPLARTVFKVSVVLFANKTICISRAVKEHSGIPDSRATVIYNPGPDLKLFDPDKIFSKIPSLPENIPIVMTIAKFLKVKGHENFIRMARCIELKSPQFYHFAILGNKYDGHEKYYTYVQNLIRKYGLKQTITILDQVQHEEVPAYLSRAAVFVHLPNWQEGLGGVILEAMAMRLPVVAFDCGGVGECFRDGVSGFLVQKGNVLKAAEKVLELLHDPEMRTSIGAQARKDLLSRFSYEKHFAEINKIYGMFI